MLIDHGTREVEQPVPEAEGPLCRDQLWRDAMWAQPRPGVPVKTASLIMALSRAMMMRREWNRVVSEVSPRYAAGAIDRDVYTFTLWNWMCLWLGCLEVVVEGFEQGYQHDPDLLDQTVSGLLASPFRPMLKGFRNKIFHPEPFNHSKVLEVLEQLHDFVPWAESLTDELEAFFRRYLAAWCGSAV